MSPTDTADKQAGKELSEKIGQFLNGGAACLMLSIGHRTGLFRIMADLKPSTSAEISQAAGLNERYVREWLNSMTVSGVIEYTPADKTYKLPEAHAGLLTDGGGMPNMSVVSQYFAMLGSVEDEIIDCFKNGGGVPYDRFHRFHEIMAEESGQTVLPALVDKIVPLADPMHELLKSGIRCADVGCGRGRALIQLAEAFPASTFVGYDLSEEALQHARDEAKKKNLQNIVFHSVDATALSDADGFDLITAFDAIHDQAFPQKVLDNIFALLRPGGTFLMQDIDSSSYVEKNLSHPIGTFLYTISCMHCMTVSLAQGGEGLGAAWGREMAHELLQKAGFQNVEIYELDHDPVNCFFVAKKS